MDLWLNRVETIPSDHPLYGCRLKLERAHVHLRELQTAVTLLDDHRNDLYTIHREFNAEGRTLTISGRMKRPWPAPIEHAVEQMPLAFGDCIHNLRSTLDYAVNELVRHFTGKASKTAAFPIFTVKDGPKGYLCKSPAMLPGLPKPICELIESMQPYHGGDAQVFPAAHSRTLQDLWNKDKHRSLLLTPSSMWFDYIGHNRTEREQSGIAFVMDRAQDSPRYVAADATTDEEFDPHFTVRVTLGESGPLNGVPITETAGVLDLSVRDVIARFRPLFQSP